MSNSAIIDGLDDELEKTSKIAKLVRLDKDTATETVAMFDLSSSTSLKKDKGHDSTMTKIFLYNQICRFILKKFKGKVVKDLGDGVLVRFSNPLNACLAAINIQYASLKRELPSKAALALGIVEEAKINNTIDIFGITVDRCARMEKCALPNQILIDRSLFDTIETFLKDYDDVNVGQPITIDLKGCGENQLYEIASKLVELRNQILTK